MPNEHEIPEPTQLLKSFIDISYKYKPMLRAHALNSVQIANLTDRQHYIDITLNLFPYLQMPHVLVILLVTGTPIVIPEYLGELDGTWPQIIYGIARATVERDLKQAIEEALEEAEEESREAVVAS